MSSHEAPDTIPAGIFLEDAPCPCGCPPGDEPVLSGGDRLNGLPGHFSVVKCRTCGLKRTNPRPDAASIGYFYPTDYDPYKQSMVTPSPARKRGWRGLAHSFFDSRSTILPHTEPGRMLEIGCAAGANLQLMASRGWEVTGLEPSSEAAEFARSRGFEVANCELEAASYADQSLDLILGWMVMEHLHDPVACLEKMHHWLRPDGWLAFSVPNAGSYEFNLFGDAWFALQLPTHLFHYDPPSLETVLNKAGWRLDRVFFQRNNSNLVYSLGYKCRDWGWRRLGDYLVKGSLQYSLPFRLLTYPYAWLASRFGSAGRMTVWARKA